MGRHPPLKRVYMKIKALMSATINRNTRAVTGFFMASDAPRIPVTSDATRNIPGPCNASDRALAAPRNGRHHRQGNHDPGQDTAGENCVHFQMHD